MKYEYTKAPPPKKTQYDNIGGKETIVEAKYIHTYGCEGNPYLEALPPRTSKEMCLEKYTKLPRVPTKEERETLSQEDLIASLVNLDEFRTFLPFHLTLERAFRSALESSYKRRVVISDDALVNRLQVNNREFISHKEMRIGEQSDAPTGFAVLGLSSCGKTTGINGVLSTYPQTIIHNPGTMQQTTQIVYLHVECTNTNAFADLYAKIGQCIDRALHNYDGTYQKMLSAKTTISKLNFILETLVEKFSIGMIILDEIEHMEMVKATEQSFESFLRLSNNTGVVVSVIGTQDAYEKMFSKRRTARRVGELIQASKYCENKEHFVRIVKNLTLFQWTDKKITFTAEDLEELYRCTDGVIGEVVKIYAKIQSNAIEGKKTDRAAIHRIILQHYQGLKHAKDKEQDMMAKEGRDLSLEEGMKANTAEEIIRQVNDEQEFEKLVNGEQLDRNELCRNVVKAVSDFTSDYNVAAIEKAFDKVMEQEGTEKMSMTAIAMMTVAVLSKKKSDRKKGIKKTAVEKALEAVMTQVDLASIELQEGVGI